MSKYEDETAPFGPTDFEAHLIAALRRDIGTDAYYLSQRTHDLLATYDDRSSATTEATWKRCSVCGGVHWCDPTVVYE